MFDKIKFPSYVPEKLRKRYSYINFRPDKSPYLSIPWGQPLPPVEVFNNYRYIHTFYVGNEISMNDISKYIHENCECKDILSYAVAVEYPEDDCCSIMLKCNQPKVNVKYKQELSAHNKRIAAISKEKEIFKEIMSLYEAWYDKERTKKKVAEFKKLKEELIAKKVKID
jgi:hypothetical protein